ncbi:MAG TPA: hypothetical protein VL500_00520 [Candidatus Eisenbacteria bacterium]|nr:hypothetical protein [Candidatus Eisenbacteria bacterium]
MGHAIVPLWAYVAATAIVSLWFRRVRDAAEDPDLFHSRSRTGSLLHGAVWMAVLLDGGLAKSDALLAVFAINMFGTLFYAMCMRRADAPD